MTDHFKLLSSPCTPKAVFLSKDTLIESLLRMVTCSSRPLTMVNDEWFKKLVEPYERAFGMCITYRFVIDCIYDAYEELTNMLKGIVKDRMLCLKSDCVTRMDRSFIGVNIQFVFKGEIIVITLGTIQLDNHHTGPNLKNALMNSLKKVDISISQLYTITTDNGADLCKAARLMEKATNEKKGSEASDAEERSESEWNENEEFDMFDSTKDLSHSGLLDEIEDSTNVLLDIENIEWDGNILMSKKNIFLYFYYLSLSLLD